MENERSQENEKDKDGLKRSSENVNRKKINYQK